MAPLFSISPKEHNRWDRLDAKLAAQRLCLRRSIGEVDAHGDEFFRCGSDSIVGKNVAVHLEARWTAAGHEINHHRPPAFLRCLEDFFRIALPRNSSARGRVGAEPNGE